jgi:hypothetical protein
MVQVLSGDAGFAGVCAVLVGSGLAMLAMVKEGLCRWSRVYVDDKSQTMIHIKRASSNAAKPHCTFF